MLFQAAFTLAFFGFLRVSEFAAVSRTDPAKKCLALSDVSLHGDLSVLQVRLGYSKTDQRGESSVLSLGNAGNSLVYPVAALCRFLRVRPPGDGPLFIHLDRSPLTKFQVNQVLKKGLQLKGFPHQSYSTHSFRIGAATSAAANGFSDEEIQSLGRWRSSAFQRYIRPASLFTASHV